MSFPVIYSNMLEIYRNDRVRSRALFSRVEKIEKSINVARIRLVVNEPSINTCGDVYGMCASFRVLHCVQCVAHARRNQRTLLSTGSSSSLYGQIDSNDALRHVSPLPHSDYPFLHIVIITRNMSCSTLRVISLRRKRLDVYLVNHQCSTGRIIVTQEPRTYIHTCIYVCMYGHHL